MFSIRVYGILINEQRQVLVSDELIHGMKITNFPGGGLEPGEGTRDCLKREFMEETGQPVDGDFIPLDPVTLKSGKIIHAWAVEGDINDENIVSNLFEMEWPPKSGKKQSFPEIDRAGWFDEDEARLKLSGAQAGKIDYFLSKQLD